MLKYCYVPNDFGKGILVPIPKDKNKSGILTPSDYRGITLSPILSKVFEHALFYIFRDFLFSSERQFGFKKNLSCVQSLFCVNKVIDFFVDNGSTVNMCCLDISKAFDKIDHNILFSKLLQRGVPPCFVLTLLNWYSKSYSKIQWGDILSSQFQMTSGVRQGGVLSPTLFAVYVDSLLYKLNNYGCFVNNVCYGSFMYADDLVLLAPSIDELQKMVNICSNELDNIGLSLNEKKSFFLRFGKQWSDCSAKLTTPTGEISRVLSGRYLGVDIVSGPKLSVNFVRPKSKFYSSFNSLYSHLGAFNNEIVSLHLAQSICVPGLLYGTEAFNFNKTTIRELELPWSRVFYKVFKTFDPEIIKYCQYYCGYSTMADMITSKRIKFLRKIKLSCNKLLINLL